MPSSIEEIDLSGDTMMGEVAEDVGIITEQLIKWFDQVAMPRDCAYPIDLVPEREAWKVVEPHDEVLLCWLCSLLSPTQEYS